MNPDAAARQFFERGWLRLPHDDAVASWVDATRPVAERLLADKALRARWLRCGGTWFAGVNVLPNDTQGAIATEGVPPLSGSPVAFMRDVLGFRNLAWDAAQISICLPGYPAAPSDGESEAAFRFRRDRDAAHVDGLMRDPARRRSVGEVHGFILGLPLTDVPAEASPLTVWEGSHEIMRRAFRERLSGIPTAHWTGEDVTEAYVAARRHAFDVCRRVKVHARPGECYFVHRLALHGVAPWGEQGGTAPRMIAYFRPDPFPGCDLSWWLERD